MGTKSDPSRLPRRNHYQEGPGFLFLATENGRPPSASAPARLAAVVRQRRAAVRAWDEGGSPAEVCAVRLQPSEPLPLAGAAPRGRHRRAR